MNWKLKIGQNIDKSSKHRFVKVLHEFEEKKLVTCVSFPLPNKTKLEYDMVNVLLFG